ncbi:pre-mRNA-processing factor 17-like [Artemia franciscana]|uniref:Pre-mRNA-processing factor 17 n=1 Tax=Artemia franciscana TaxID=6661 RepID=A0AA88L456_ARTSF|nr:hypothetical protein QYM36_010556 [Artemia franciscana]
MNQLVTYDRNSDSESDSDNEEVIHKKAIDPSKSSVVILANTAPDVVPQEDHHLAIDPRCKELTYNPKAEDLFAPLPGPEWPFKTQQMKAPRNALAGFVEPAHVNDFQFEAQRRTFSSYGYAIDPSLDGKSQPCQFIGSSGTAEKKDGASVFESTEKRPLDKRKRETNDNPEDTEGFLGPWGKFVDEKTVAKPSPEEAAELEEILFKRQKTRRGQKEDASFEEKTMLHIKDPHDYQGRSFMHAPHDVGVNLRSESPPDKCFVPKKLLHTWTGHSKALNQIRLIPKTAHLLLSCSMDGKVKLWEVYNQRRCIRSYLGHRQGVRDVNFNNDGTQFLSTSFDRYIKLWDTETGQCISRFTNKKVAYCVKFNPDEDKQNLFVCGTSDNKIISWDVRTGEITQEYNRHLGAVNALAFIDENRRFVTTSDDKSLRVWEWDIPVDIKYIADPTMHSMPAIAVSPNQKWIACQSLDNKITIFSALEKFRMYRKKTFTGHMVAGYACGLDFSPEMSYLVSGDGDGKLFIWDWRTTKLQAKFKAHDGVCISVVWHPHETSKIISAGWDNVIKLWD